MRDDFNILSTKGVHTTWPWNSENLYRYCSRSLKNLRNMTRNIGSYYRGSTSCVVPYDESNKVRSYRGTFTSSDTDIIAADQGTFNFGRRFRRLTCRRYCGFLFSARLDSESRSPNPNSRYWRFVQRFISFFCYWFNICKIKGLKWILLLFPLQFPIK